MLLVTVPGMEKSEKPAEILLFEPPEPEVFQPISDAELTKGGMEKTTAWVRSDISKAALRQAKHRKKQAAKIAVMAEASGEAEPVPTVQVNLGQLPAPTAKHLRDVAASLRSGASLSEAVASLPGVEPIAVREIERMVNSPVPDPDTIAAVQQLRETFLSALRVGLPLIFVSGLGLGLGLGFFAAWWIL